MKRLNINPIKYCFISRNGQSDLADHINLSRYDVAIDLTFKNLNFTKLKVFSPHIIVVDQYFTKKTHAYIIDSLKMNFKNVNIYLLSPRLISSTGLVQSKNCKNHYSSRFSNAILNHINNFTDRLSNNNYLEAG
jgi:hypothetical protein